MHTVGQRLGNCREDGVAPCPGQRCAVETWKELIVKQDLLEHQEPIDSLTTRKDGKVFTHYNKRLICKIKS
jgi:hypothetical protein